MMQGGGGEMMHDGGGEMMMNDKMMMGDCHEMMENGGMMGDSKQDESSCPMNTIHKLLNHRNRNYAPHQRYTERRSYQNLFRFSRNQHLDSSTCTEYD